MNTVKPSPPPSQQMGATPPNGVFRISSQQLFAGAREIEICHQDALYRLRQTSTGKLILTK